jgi:1-acyl-sn-glycerol-3-phosphate acyltransferase
MPFCPAAVEPISSSILLENFVPSEWKQPSDREMRALLGLLVRPLSLVARPLFFGWENIPDERPLMFVGNHALYAFIDTPLLFSGLYLEKGIYLRGLGDAVLFRFPGWRDLLGHYGIVESNRQNCERLLNQGQCMLLFPGGAREAAKRKGEANRLFWKKRAGFARLALRHRCTVVPLASLGVDDAFDIAFDSGDLQASRLGKLYEKLGIRPELVLPIPRKVRPERVYFKFCPPLPADRYLSPEAEPAQVAVRLRDNAHDAVLQGLDFLKEVRDKDQERYPLARARTTLSNATFALRRNLQNVYRKAGREKKEGR